MCASGSENQLASQPTIIITTARYDQLIGHTNGATRLKTGQHRCRLQMSTIDAPRDHPPVNCCSHDSYSFFPLSYKMFFCRQGILNLRCDTCTGGNVSCTTISLSCSRAWIWIISKKWNSLIVSLVIHFRRLLYVMYTYYWSISVSSWIILLISN